ncbi:CHAT domain-containing protein [Baaleninema simplex]|uniref:CHAT domain-containing protein n=1 Tax=Baaleninema simplex TaxID=2862350 RepID=UPI00034A4499|nr:CHAT domain-containing protein [Baaleninema simplex]
MFGNTSPLLSIWRRFWPRGRVGLVLLALFSLAIALVFARPATSTDEFRSPETPAIAQTAPLAIDDRLERGRDLYRAGQFAEAVTVWQAAAIAADRRGDRLDLALVSSYLASAFERLGQSERADRAIDEAMASISEVLTDETSQQPTYARLVAARTFNTRGHLQLGRGQAADALESWQQAEAYYRQAGDEEGVLGTQVDRATAFRALGQYRRAREILEAVERSLSDQPDSSLKAAGLLDLGNTLRALGELERSQTALQQSLAIAERVQSPSHERAALLGLARTARVRGDRDRAFDWYDRADTMASSPRDRVLVGVDRLSFAIETEQWERARTFWQQVRPQFSQLPSDRTAVELRTNAAHSLMDWQAAGLGDAPPPAVAADLLATAVRDARSLRDRRAQSYALGELARSYERTNRLPEALDLTQRALALAETADAPEVAYQWQWQTGRLLRERDDRAGAIAAYTEAVNTLNRLRKDLVATPELQFGFRDRVEPVYRELVDLLLVPEAGRSDLEQARQTLEAMQLAELENFFREACLEGHPQQIDEIDRAAAAFYPIILPDRLVVMLSIPGEPLRYYDTPIPQAEVEAVLEEMQTSLNPSYPNQWRLQLSRQVYDWLIRPAETDLAGHDIETLVFVLDGLLRNLPMAALYDGDRYLVEQYGIALTPGLQLLPSASPDSQQLKVLMGGLTEARQGFSALPGVSLELEQIESEGVSTSEPLLNERFTELNLERRIGTTSFPIVHLATHGQLSSEPEETFVLTWDDKIDVRELGSVLQSRTFEVATPIDLLVLSACQTASGDDLAALGLAGLAVRSGVRSTLATLWSVNDRSTAMLVGRFYREFIQNGTSKAEALRQSQLALLRQSQYQHPFYWSAFVIVGNWSRTVF